MLFAAAVHVGLPVQVTSSWLLHACAVSCWLQVPHAAPTRPLTGHFIPVGAMRKYWCHQQLGFELRALIEQQWGSCPGCYHGPSRLDALHGVAVGVMHFRIRRRWQLQVGHPARVRAK
jgi:hypothetical protein